jgi:2-hydroxychromene-2-carboxylate isomerase
MNNYAFIDGNNLYLGVRNQEWKLGYKKNKNEGDSRGTKPFGSPLIVITIILYHKTTNNQTTHPPIHQNKKIINII